MARLVTGAVANTMSYLTNYYNDYTTLGQDKEILAIGNVLNSIFVNRDNISIPQLVTIGSQSSGKSSILNSILGIDILPTGSNMVTRTPLQLELIQSIKDVKAFGEYVSGDQVVLNQLIFNILIQLQSKKMIYYYDKIDYKTICGFRDEYIR